MNRKLYVGNLAFATEEPAVEALFSGVSTVTSVRLMRGKATGQSRGRRRESRW
jgi:RNA recognition motif-containing protein